ncbi:MAG: hypothetical protein ABS35_18320 [Kaistia sp. SCN 65-12]|nr:MAG: hypothetical protein ABS35_18320 [Kaistia sp. SCN 65-12]
MLCILATAVLVHDIEHPANELSIFILPDILGDGDEIDPGLAQPPDIEFRVEAVAAEAAE